jgi:hypothetical protein
MPFQLLSQSINFIHSRDDFYSVIDASPRFSSMILAVPRYSLLFPAIPHSPKK